MREEENMVIELNSSSDNLVNLISCRNSTKNKKIKEMLDDIIHLKTSVMLIEVMKTCDPIIEEYNKAQNKEEKKKVVNLISSKSKSINEEKPK